MLDLSKLTPAPWYNERRFSNGCEIVPRICCEKNASRECGRIADLVGAPYLGYESTLVNAEFIALARNAFDVMVRRGWSIRKDKLGSRWHVPEAHRPNYCAAGDDPFTALVEADKWYKENVEGRPCL
jgi:hypothetical protein